MLSRGLKEDAEVFVEEDVGVEHDRALRHLPGTLDLAQQILAAAGEELVIGFEMRAVYQKRGPGLDLAVLQRYCLEIADQVTGARRGSSAQAIPVSSRATRISR